MCSGARESWYPPAAPRRLVTNPDFFRGEMSCSRYEYGTADSTDSVEIDAGPSP
jgi:hypothetical protein